MRSWPTRTLWDLWHFGNQAEGIRPYRFLRDQNHQDDLKSSREKSCLCRAGKIMDKIEGKARQMGLLQANSNPNARRKRSRQNELRN